MPKVNWGIPAGTVENWDRESQFTPYDGPIPPNSVYLWHIKKLVFVAPTDEKLPQLRIGLELRARTNEEKRYAGYFIMLFRSIGERNAGFWVPFLDAIGVSESDFRQRTIADQDGNIKKIGRWGNDGKQLIKGQLRDDNRDGNVRKDIGWMGAYDGVPTYAEDDEDWEETEVDGDGEEWMDDEGVAALDEDEGGW